MNTGSSLKAPANALIRQFSLEQPRGSRRGSRQYIARSKAPANNSFERPRSLSPPRRHCHGSHKGTTRILKSIPAKYSPKQQRRPNSQSRPAAHSSKDAAGSNAPKHQLSDRSLPHRPARPRVPPKPQNSVISLHPLRHHDHITAKGIAPGNLNYDRVHNDSRRNERRPGRPPPRNLPQSSR